jgi:hypothetical protein
MKEPMIPLLQQIGIRLLLMIAVEVYPEIIVFVPVGVPHA